jgi:hypothetical protein
MVSKLLPRPIALLEKKEKLGSILASRNHLRGSYGTKSAVRLPGLLRVMVSESLADGGLKRSNEKMIEQG